MTSTEDFKEKSEEIMEEITLDPQYRECLNAQTSQELKTLLQQNGMKIEDVLSTTGGLAPLERNQVGLIYCSNQKWPFLLGHKVKYAPSDSTIPTVRIGIICGIVVEGKNVDLERLWIYDEDLRTIDYVPLSDIVFPPKRINCHPDIKKQLEQFVSNPDYDKSLLLIPKLSSQCQDNDNDDSDRIIANISSVYTKPKLFSRDDTRIPWYELVDSKQPLCFIVEELFKLFTVFEDEEVVLPIVVAASCQPSAISRYSQISVFYGLSGSGKSSCCHVIEGMYNLPKVLSSITYAALRNHVNEHRFMNSTEYSGEKNFHIVIDEISSEALAEPRFYTLLKGGVSIATSEVRISSEKSGENKSFNCFGPKSFSTCNPFWQEQRYDEIRRRLFIFETKKISDGDFLSKEEINYNECDHPLSQVLQGFWVENQSKYKQFVRKLKGDDRDILATICCLYSVETSEAKKMLKSFRDVTQNKTYKPDTRIEYLESFLTDYVFRASGTYARAKRMGAIENPKIDIRVKAADLTHHFREGANAGIFEREQVTSKNIFDLMTAKGYQLKAVLEGISSTGQTWYWVKPFNPEEKL